MNKLKEQINARYGSFELSHNKNELIVQNIEEFMSKVSIKYGDYLQKHCKPSLDAKHKYDWFDMSTSKHYTHEEIFTYFKENVYEKD